MEINGKKYEIITNIPLGLMFEYQSGKLKNVEGVTKFLQAIMVPSPDDKVIREDIGYDDLMDIYSEFNEKIKEKNKDMRKKFSQ